MSFKPPLVNNQNLVSILSSVRKYSQAELMIVTKNQNVEAIKVLIQLGHVLFGENKVQEAMKKFSQIKSNKIELHLIGPLQTNKVKDALRTFDTIQSIDRIKLVNEITKHLNKNDKTKNFFIQVNIGNEPQKSGVAPEELKNLYNYSIEKGLLIRGLMCIPPINKDPSVFFKRLKDLKNSINSNLKLSMGMSNDYLEALRCDSNMVRIGSLIFK